MGKHKVADMTSDEAREYCLSQERERMRKHQDTLQGAFEASMVSLDTMTAGLDDPGKMACFSDGGAGAEAVADGGAGRATWRQKRDNAARRLRRARKQHLVPVFLLICKNGNNREESICELAFPDNAEGPSIAAFRQHYCVHRKKLLIFFDAQ